MKAGKDIYVCATVGNVRAMSTTVFKVGVVVV